VVSAPPRSIDAVDPNIPIIGTEALASGALTRGQLRWNYRAVLPDVYLRKDQQRTLAVDTVAAWLWTRRTGIVAGRAAAALWGVCGVEDSTPIELIARRTRPQYGVVVREERIADDEVCVRGELRVTSPARTALDLARHVPLGQAVEYLDALVRASCLTGDDVARLVERYRGARGISTAREALWLMDGGASCAEETRMRLLLYATGVPRPSTDISVEDGGHVARIAMGWEDVKLGVSFFAPPRPGGCAAVQDLRHHEIVQRAGWTEIGYIGMSHARLIAHRVRDELWQRRRRLA
jgi:hypothetical protein